MINALSGSEKGLKDRQIIVI